MKPKFTDMRIVNKTKFKNKNVVNMEIKGTRGRKMDWTKTKQAIKFIVDGVATAQKKFTLNVNALLPTGDISLVADYLAFNTDNLDNELDNYEEYLEIKVKDVKKFLTADMVSLSFMY